MLYDLYKEGKITFEEYCQKLMERFDAVIKAAEERIKELDAIKESRNV
jgi:hypothetical protein